MGVSPISQNTYNERVETQGEQTFLFDAGRARGSNSLARVAPTMLLQGGRLSPETCLKT